MVKEFILKHWTSIVATVALLQPWVIALLKKIFKKGKIDIFQSGTIEIGYSSFFGSTVGLNGTLRCVNQDLFVESINLEIIKQKDSSKHFFDWGLFRSQRLTLKGEEAELELPYGLMLNTTQPKRFNILFIDQNSREEMQTILRKVSEEWSKTISKEIQAGIASNDTIISKKYYDEFSKSGTHVDAFSKLDRLCYWEPGEYLLVFKVQATKPNHTTEKSWKFRLTDDDVRSIRLNVVKILQDTCVVPSYGQYFFAYARYEEL